MERFLILFCVLICTRAQLLIYPDEYDRMTKAVPYYNQDSSRTAYNSPSTVNTYNSLQKKLPQLHHVFPQNWTEHVTNIISKGITKFALDMDEAIYRTRDNSNGHRSQENIVFSPISLSGTMAIVLLAAGGKTFDEVAKILGLESGVDVSRNSEVVHEMFGLLLSMIDTDKANNGPEASYANGIFIQEGYPIRPEFSGVNENVYKSEIISLDFHNHGEKAKESINKWVKDRTRGKIPKILSSVPNPETDVILASALYFNGEWDQYFIDFATMRKPFNIEPGQTVNVDMMYNGADFPFYEDKRLGVKILGLPYKQLKVTMYVLLPNAPGAAALKAFERKLNPDILENLIQNIQNQTCIVGFPRMELSSSLSLKRAFQSLGLKTLFDPVKADLSLLSPGLNGMIPDSSKIGGRDQQLRPQDGFYFPPRLGENTQENKTSKSNPSRINYIRNPREKHENEGSETVTAATREDRVTRQSRPIDQDFLNFLESHNLPSFGLDALRNSADIENPGLYAEDVLHRVEININEKGTEAAAATAVAIERTGSQKRFIANRPFLFFIRHEQSKLIWFWGSVNTPTPNYPVDNPSS
ncbi:leukocyte elastase inhibitor isoform X2 [Belonocnema kinseyi]|uniref:leukocyte elastase inhibitor isoform X2 n=1 Tax=Belonocnema kinseyi TaxID=2817044 RepID=UPI00143D372D|nr:leukocyte elastase inhibitor isoform X2 [Belonocnema kinseyi]